MDDAGLCCPQCSTGFVIPAEGVAALNADSYVLGVAKQKESASKVNPNDVKCECETSLRFSTAHRVASLLERIV